MMRGHASNSYDPSHVLHTMRAMSLPDMAELSDIVALEDVINNDERDDCSSPLDQNYPVRLVSIGLHRSMSMPKQQMKETFEEVKAEDDFFFPDDDSEHSAAANDSFIPKFYSNETLAGVLPPAGKKISSPVMNAKHREEQIKRREKSRVQTESESDKENISASFREAAAKKAAQREAALSSLSAFFGGGSAVQIDTSASPTCVSRFSSDEETESVLKTRSKTLPSCSEALETTKHKQELGQSSSPPRRSIFGKICTEQPCSTASDFEFKMLQESDRTTSMPTKLPSSKLPRKPSLKKVSSFVGNPKSEKSTDMKPSVSFSNLQIREYDVMLGDNPSCSYGPPVSLGWDYHDAAVVPLEKYERARSNKFPRRKSGQLVLSYNVRKYLLLKTAGYTKAELREAMKEVERIKHERKMTDIMAPLEPLDEVMEGVINHVKGMFQKK